MTADERTLPNDPERTLLMPTPGGQATVAMKRAGATARPDVGGRGVELKRLLAGINPLLGAANVLLALVAQLRATTTHADPAGLRPQLVDHVKEFEALATAHGVPRPQITAARYLLCSFIDEVIAATPWGAEGGWAQRTLLQEFHNEQWGGEKAFKLLERLGNDVAGNANLLELYYVCLALGFEGRYRGVRNGRAQLDAIADRVLEVVRPARGRQLSRTLALRWQGVQTAGKRGLAVLPLWVVLAVGAALLLALFLFLNARLNERARPVFQQIHAVPAALQLDRSASVAAKPRLAALLQEDVAAGAVEVRDEAQRSTLTLSADRLFAPGTARIEAGQLELLARVARSLAGLSGEVLVIGHTDDLAVASLQFPSSWHLSRERAQAVTGVLAQQGVSAERLRAEGRADVEPLLPNTGPAERARNRRIVIELLLPRPDS